MAILKESENGIEVSWRNGGSRVIPLLTRDELRAFAPRVFEESKEWENDKGDMFTLPLEMFHAVLRRRYPNITILEIKDNLDHRTFVDAWQKLWAASWLNLVKIVGPHN